MGLESAFTLQVLLLLLQQLGKAQAAAALDASVPECNSAVTHLLLLLLLLLPKLLRAPINSTHGDAGLQQMVTTCACNDT